MKSHLGTARKRTQLPTHFDIYVLHFEQYCASENQWSIYRQLSVLLSLPDPSSKPLLPSLDRLGISDTYPSTLLFGYGGPLPSTNDITYFFPIGPFHKIYNLEFRKGQETHKDFLPLLVGWDNFQSFSWHIEGKKHLHLPIRSRSSCLGSTIGQGGKDITES